MKFQNQSNGYIENCSVPFLWALIFGPFYFVLKGIWRHVVLYFSVNVLLFSISWSLAGTAGFFGTIIAGEFADRPQVLENLPYIVGSIVAAAIIVPFLFYPFIASGIVRRHFLRQGWVEIQ